MNQEKSRFSSCCGLTRQHSSTALQHSETEYITEKGFLCTLENSDNAGLPDELSKLELCLQVMDDHDFRGK